MSGSVQVADLFSVKGKNVLVTGGSEGLGFLIARAFAKNGANVFICSRKKENVDKAVQKLTAEGGKAAGFEADISVEANCKTLAKQIATLTGGKLDVLINNAGATWGAPFEEYPDKAWDKLWALNVKAIFHMIRACKPLLKAAGSEAVPSKVINISSIASFETKLGNVYAYNATKAAVNQLTRVLAPELAQDNITCNALLAGFFETHMSRGTLNAFGEVIVSGIPMKRIGHPTDIAGVMLWLSSNAGNWVTGSLITVDGGALVSARL